MQRKKKTCEDFSTLSIDDMKTGKTKVSVWEYSTKTQQCFVSRKAQ